MAASNDSRPGPCEQALIKKAADRAVEFLEFMSGTEGLAVAKNGRTVTITYTPPDDGGGDPGDIGIEDVDGLSAALAGKAATSHTHPTSEVTGLDAALAGKAASSHTHATSEVTGLDAALAGKAASSHTHNASDINAGTLDAARLPAAGITTIGGVKRNTGSAGEFVTGVASDGSLERGIPGDSVAAFVPIGMVVPYAGWNVLPDNYLFCDGTIYDVNDPDYSNLGWVLGGNYGMGSNKGTTLSITSGSTIITASGAHGLSVGDTIFSIVWKQMTSSGFMALDGLQSFDAYACEVLTVPSSTTFTIATLRGSGVAKSSSQTLSGITWRDEFAVPDLRGRVPAGRDDLGGSAASRLSSAGFGGVATAVGRSGGSETHQLVEAEIPTFTKYSSHSSASNTATTGGAARVGVLNTVSYGGGGAHKNVQPTLTINYLIRYS